MHIAAAAMRERRFAQALGTSLAVHALAFYTLGHLPPHARVEQPPLEVRLLQPPPALEPVAVAVPEPAVEPVRPQPQAKPREARAAPAPSRPRPLARPEAAEPAPALPAPAIAARPPEPPAAAEAPPPVAAAVLPADPPPPAADRRALQASFGRGLEQAIDAAKHYPRIARERGWQGTVRVRLRFLPGGSLGQVEVVDSSGFPLLDEHAVQMARAAELPRVPNALLAEAFELDVPIRFRLRG
jgi:protein TonB